MKRRSGERAFVARLGLFGYGYYPFSKFSSLSNSGARLGASLGKSKSAPRHQAASSCGVQWFTDTVTEQRSIMVHRNYYINNKTGTNRSEFQVLFVLRALEFHGVSHIDAPHFTHGNLAARNCILKIYIPIVR